MCPECGEQTGFGRRPAQEFQPESGELEQLIRRPRDVPPEELAA